MNIQALCWLPFIMLIEYLLSLSVAMLTSGITVYLRDVEYILAIIVMAWQFLTPVLYSMEQVPEEIKVIFTLNPMSPIIIAYRDILYYGKAPNAATLMQAIILGIILLMIGCFSFSKLKKHFAEEL